MNDKEGIRCMKHYRKSMYCPICIRDVREQEREKVQHLIRSSSNFAIFIDLYTKYCEENGTI